MLLTEPTIDFGDRKTFSAWVVNPIFGFEGMRVFYEEEPGTNTYKTRRLLLEVSMQDLPLESQLDTILATLTTDVPGTLGATELANVTLTETGVDTNIFASSDNNFSLELVRITTKGSTGRDDLTAIVNSTVLGVDSQAVDAIESDNTSLEFFTSMLTNNGDAILEGPNPLAVIGRRYRIKVRREESGNELRGKEAKAILRRGDKSTKEIDEYKLGDKESNQDLVAIRTTDEVALFKFKPREDAEDIVREGTTTTVSAAAGTIVDLTCQGTTARIKAIHVSVDAHYADADETEVVRLNRSQDSGIPEFGVAYLTPDVRIGTTQGNRIEGDVILKLTVAPFDVSGEWGGDGVADPNDATKRRISRNAPKKNVSTVMVGNVEVQTVTTWVIKAHFPQDAFKKTGSYSADNEKGASIYYDRGAQLGPVNQGEQPSQKASAPVANATNKGNGSMSAVLVTGNVDSGDWQIVKKAEGDKWAVLGTLDNDPPITEEATTGQEYTSGDGKIKFTITQGTVAFQENDSFRFFSSGAAVGFYNNAEIRAEIEPAGVAGHPDVKFNFRRTAGGRDWVDAAPTDTADPNSPKTEDDGDDNDEALTVKRDDNIIYSCDTPGRRKVEPAEFVNQMVLKDNFVESVDVIYNNGDRHTGDKCSDDLDWHSTIWLIKNQGNVERDAAKTRLDTGHQQIGNDP